ncbi:DUF3742 family protein [Burkholderia multivorans]|uniref:DUF3742 family protein n=1 Tax=Burkholderia multivorans TaxID=87883 RepID=UPI001C97BA5D|nr:DUF3742 family protein [Burkholderia multivorans]MBY4674340.1 DUF3742 family protein [Burkholderia multivorans]
MSTKTYRSNAERLGHWLGRVWRGYVHRERQVKAWLTAQGVPAGGAVALLWIVKLGALAILFYVAFWLALLFMFAVVAAWIAKNDDGSYDEEHKAEWRHGPAGYGLYSFDEYRIDPHDPEDDPA